MHAKNLGKATQEALPNPGERTRERLLQSYEQMAAVRLSRTAVAACVQALRRVCTRCDMCCSGLHLGKQDLVIGHHVGIADGRGDVHLNAELSAPRS